MTRSTSNVSDPGKFVAGAESRWSHDRAFLPDKAHLAARELPLELAFLAGEDLSSELMVDGVGDAQRDLVA